MRAKRARAISYWKRFVIARENSKMKFLTTNRYLKNIKELIQSLTHHPLWPESRPTGLGISLSGIGVIVGAPLAGFAGLLRFISTAMTVGGKRFNIKITKHEKTVSLVESSALSISKLISKALNDCRISDTEFNLILREVEQYHLLKKGLRSSSTEGVDVEDKKRISKKLGSLVNVKN